MGSILLFVVVGFPGWLAQVLSKCAACKNPGIVILGLLVMAWGSFLAWWGYQWALVGFERLQGPQAVVTHPVAGAIGMASGIVIALCGLGVVVAGATAASRAKQGEARQTAERTATGEEVAASPAMEVGAARISYVIVGPDNPSTRGASPP